MNCFGARPSYKKDSNRNIINLSLSLLPYPRDLARRNAVRWLLSFLVGVLSIVQASALEKHPQSQHPGSHLARYSAGFKQPSPSIPQGIWGGGSLGLDYTEKSPMETTKRKLEEAQHKNPSVAQGNIRCRPGACVGVFGAATCRANGVNWVSLKYCDLISTPQLARCGKSNDGCLGGEGKLLTEGLNSFRMDG